MNCTLKNSTSVPVKMRHLRLGVTRDQLGWIPYVDSTITHSSSYQTVWVLNLLVGHPGPRQSGEASAANTEMTQEPQPDPGNGVVVEGQFSIPHVPISSHPILVKRGHDSRNDTHAKTTVEVKQSSSIFLRLSNKCPL